MEKFFGDLERKEAWRRARNYTAEKTETPSVEPIGGPINSPAREQAGGRFGPIAEGCGGRWFRAFHALLDRHMHRLYRLAVFAHWKYGGCGGRASGDLCRGVIVVWTDLKGALRLEPGLTRILVMQVARFRRDRKRKSMGFDRVGGV